MRVFLLLLVLFLFPVILFACILVGLTLPLPEPFPPALSQGRNVAVAIMTCFVGLVYVVGVGVYLIYWLTHPGVSFDRAFSTAGLDAVRHGAFASRYSGTMQGRSATATLQPAFKVQPWRLDVVISVDLPPDVRIAMGRTRPLLDCRGAPELTFADSSFAHCRIYAVNEQQARRLLEEPAVRNAAVRLLAELQTISSWEIYVQPDRIWARVRAYRVGEDRLTRWLEVLSELAVACDDVGR